MAAILTAFIFVFLLLPTVIVVPMAFTAGEFIQFPPDGFSLSHIGAFFDDPAWMDASRTSLSTATVAVLVSILAGSCGAIGTHGKPFPGQGVVIALIMLPLVTPLIVLALALFDFFARVGLLGSWFAIGLAHGLVATPYVYISVRASLAGLDPAQVRSAQSMGAGSLNVLWHVYLPAMRIGLLGGVLFAFAISMDEVVIASFLAGPDSTTLPVKMFQDVQFTLSPTLAVASVLLFVAAMVILIVQIGIALRSRETIGIPMQGPGRT